MSDEIIEQAARVLCAVDHGDPDDLIGEYDEFGRFTTSEVAWTEYVAQARALSDAGLLARPLPDRDEIASQVELAMETSWDDAMEYTDLPAVAADAVLSLLKGQSMSEETRWLNEIAARLEAVKEEYPYEDRDRQVKASAAWSNLYMHAPTDLRRLIAEVERLETELANKEARA